MKLGDVFVYLYFNLKNTFRKYLANGKLRPSWKTPSF